MNAITETKAAHGSIASALASAQAEMGKALKSASNPHFKSKYADLASVMDACLPALNANGIAVIQPTVDDDSGRYVETVLIHGESGQELRCRVPLIVSKNDMQGYGSAVTYGRRYGLMSMAGIAPEDDDGNAAAKAAPASEKSPPASDRQRPAFNARAAADRIITKIHKCKSLDDLMECWTSEGEVILEIKNADARIYAEMDRVKNDAKSALDAAAKTSADLGGDEIPF